jgi:hypothetical protein
MLRRVPNGQRAPFSAGTTCFVTQRLASLFNSFNFLKFADVIVRQTPTARTRKINPLYSAFGPGGAEDRHSR